MMDLELVGSRDALKQIFASRDANDARVGAQVASVVAAELEKRVVSEGRVLRVRVSASRGESGKRFRLHVEIDEFDASTLVSKSVGSEAL